MKLKEKLLDAFGSLGILLFLAVGLIIALYPLIMIGAPFWVNFIIISACSALPLLNIPLWLYGLVVAIKGPQDAVAIIYYIVFGILAIYFIVSLFKK